jgi:5-methyltetrahydropteroyltriglutamate--homocysteine methyltransferase
LHASRDRILTTHAGSLPRPEALTALYARRVQGSPVDADDIRARARDAVRRVVAKQIETGIDVINDGEQQRESFVLYLRHRLTGLGSRGSRLMQADIDRYPEFKRSFTAANERKESVSNRENLPKAIGEIAYVGQAMLDAECTDLGAALAEHAGAFTEAFMTAPSPGILASIVQNEHYDTEERYLDAVGRALSQEYQAIVRNGYSLQLDCPDLALECHCSFRHRPLPDFLAFCERVVATINTALDGIPPERVRMHVCWGNYEGPHDNDVPLREILPIILRARVGGFVLPFANPRHAHEYRLLADARLREDQLVVAGVIDTLTNFVEHPEVVADRIEQVARVIGDPSRVLAGTDCGFDTSAGMGRVAPDIVWAKLAALRDGARLASTRLFG